MVSELAGGVFGLFTKRNLQYMLCICLLSLITMLPVVTSSECLVHVRELSRTTSNLIRVIPIVPKFERRISNFIISDESESYGRGNIIDIDVSNLNFNHYPSHDRFVHTCIFW